MAKQKKPKCDETAPSGGAPHVAVLPLATKLELSADRQATERDELVKMLSAGTNAFLLGAGASVPAGLPTVDQLTKSTTKALKGDTLKLWQALLGPFGADSKVNVEDLLSELVDLMAVAHRRESRNATVKSIAVADAIYTRGQLDTALNEIKHAIATALQPEKVDMSRYRRFVEAVHRRLTAGRTSLQPVNYFLLNYDVLLERALARQRVPYADGMNGGVEAWWDPRSYQSKHVEAHVYKIHGSLDWTLLQGEAFPRRLAPAQNGEQLPNTESVLIWPAATKYREAQRDPFAFMIESFRRLLAPEGKEVVLACVGYSFGDDHINHEIAEALRRSNRRLQLVVLLGESALPSCLAQWCSDPQIGNQVRVYYQRGFVHGPEVHAASVDPGWWKFEWLVDTLEGGV